MSTKQIIENIKKEKNLSSFISILIDKNFAKELNVVLQKFTHKIIACYSSEKYLILILSPSKIENFNLFNKMLVAFFFTHINYKYAKLSVRNYK